MSWIGQPGAKSGVLIRSVTGAALAGLMFGFDTFIAFFAFSQRAVIWVYISEIFPQRMRARGQSLGSATQWIMNAVISGVFPWSPPGPRARLSRSSPPSWWCNFVVLLAFPETKGVSLEAMQARLPDPEV